MHGPDVWDIAITLVVSGGLASAAFLRHVLDLRGTVLASTIGAVIGLAAGWEYVLLLLLYLFTSFAVTRYGYSAKKAAGVAEGKRGERGWKSVLANGFVPLVLAILFLIEPQGFKGSMAGVLFVTAIAAAAADTTASELGVLCRDPVLITRPSQRVEPGTNGGISLQGQVYALSASVYTVVVGAALFSLSAANLGGGAGAEWWINNWWALPIPVAAGFLSCQLDSVLGATLENRGYLGKNSVNIISISTTTIVTYVVLVLLTV